MVGVCSVMNESGGTAAAHWEWTPGKCDAAARHIVMDGLYKVQNTILRYLLCVPVGQDAPYSLVL